MVNARAAQFDLSCKKTSLNSAAYTLQIDAGVEISVWLSKLSALVLKECSLAALYKANFCCFFRVLYLSWSERIQQAAVPSFPVK